MCLLNMAIDTFSEDDYVDITSLHGPGIANGPRMRFAKTPLDIFNENGLTFIPVWRSNHMPNRVWV